MTAAERLRSQARHLKACRELAHDGHPAQPGYGYAFTRWYLPHYMRIDGAGPTIPPAEWHEDFDQEVFASLGLGVRKAFLAPRGYAKSTKVTTVTPLIALAKQLKRYVLIVEDTGPQAKQAMDAIAREVTENPRLRGDFPDLRPAVDAKGQPVADRDDDVVFQTGARLQAKGAGMSLRGLRNREQRPDLVLLDDLENDEAVLTKYQRDKLDRWLSGTLLGALAPTADVYYVGTLLHHDAVLARVMARGAPWQAKTYKALTSTDAFGRVVEGVRDLWSENPDVSQAELASALPADLLEEATAASTWPAYWNAIRLALKRLEMGSHAFAREYLHQPVDEDAQMFPRRHYRYRDNRRRMIESEGTLKARMAITVDSAFSKKTTADYSVVATLAQVGGGLNEWDVLDVWRGRVSKAKLIERIRGVHDFWLENGYRPVIVSESVQAQTWLAEGLRDVGLSVVEVTPPADKITRAEPVTVLYENGQVWHDMALLDSDFEAELEQFPMGEHDDQVDAVVYGVDHLKNGRKAKVRRIQ